MMMKLVNDMTLSAEELSSLEEKVTNHIIKEIRVKNRTGDLDNYLKQIGCDNLITPYNTQFCEKAKIIIIGASMLSDKEIKGVAKGLGINPTRLELHLDYTENERFDFELIRNNTNYCDVIIGPISHKCIHTDGYASPVSLITDHPEEYPKFQVATDSHGLKITKQSLKMCLQETQYYKAYVLCR